MTRAIGTMAGALAGMMAMAAPAAAGGFNFHLGVREGAHGQHGVNLGLAINTGHHTAVAKVRRVWVEPTYRVVSERVWVPTVRTVYQDVPIYDACGNVIGYQREARTIQTGHWTTVQKRVLVRAGHWTTIGGGHVSNGHGSNHGMVLYRDRGNQPQPRASHARIQRTGHRR